MANLVGIDVGLVLHKATSRLCRTGSHVFSVARTFSDQLSPKRLCTYRSEPTALNLPLGIDLLAIDLLAIDGPVLLPHVINYETRPVDVWIDGTCYRSDHPRPANR